MCCKRFVGTVGLLRPVCGAGEPEGETLLGRLPRDRQAGKSAHHGSSRGVQVIEIPFLPAPFVSQTEDDDLGIHYSGNFTTDAWTKSPLEQRNKGMCSP
jgi:hypothetical protein